MEPLDAVDPLEVPADEPIVVDAAGRMWRVRYRPSWIRVLSRAAPVLVGVVLLALLLMLRV
jgi:hypothetical protein